MSISLLERLTQLPDPRDPRGSTYPLNGLLALGLLAILAGHTSLTAIAEFGRLRGQKLGHALGFRNGNMPCANTFMYLFRNLDADHLDRIIGAWLTDRCQAEWTHIAIDGKRLCGSRDGDVPGVHLLAAYAPQAAAVIAQLTVEATTNEHKVALRLLDILPPLNGAVVTADAMFTHADYCAKVLEKQGQYILYAKDNQKVLQGDVAALFDAASGGSPPIRRGVTMSAPPRRTARATAGGSGGPSPPRPG